MTALGMEKITNNEIFIGKKLKVVRDQKSGARVINLPFDFPSGERGVVIICKLKDEEWLPSDDLSSVNLNFK